MGDGRMATDQKTIEIQLRIKADAAAAKAASRQIQQDMRDVETQATRSNAAQAQSARALAEAQTAAMQRYTAARAPIRELNTLLQKRALTTADVAKAEALLDRAQAAGVITAGELAEAFAALDAAKIRDIATTRAQIATNDAAILNSRASAEVATAASEVLSGNFGRLRRTGAAFANQAGLLNKLMTPLGLGITAVGLAVAGFMAAIVNRENDLLEFNKALAATGNFAGTTGLELQGVAMQVGASTGHYDDAKAAVLALAKSGDVLGSHMKDMATVAVNMAFLTGESIDKVVNDLIALQGDPVQAISKTTSAMGLLTTAQYNEIVATQEQQGATAAAALAMHDLREASDAARTKLVENAGVVIRAWDGFKNLLSDIGHEIASIGAKQSLTEQIADLQKTLDRISKPQRVGKGETIPVNEAAVAALKARIAALQQQQTSDSFFAAGQELANQAKQKHDQALAEALASDKQGVAGLQAQLKDINQKRLEALVGVVDPTIRDRVNAAYDQQIRDAVKRANDQLPHGSTGKAKVDRTAEKIARDAAAAQQALTQALIAQQAALSPTAAIWAKYNETVEKANADAAKAKLAHGADAQAIDAQKQAVIGLAATVRDKALDALVEKDRQAWEALKRSFETPAQVRVDDALKQIDQLNQMLAKGVINAQQYHDALIQIGQKSVTGALPHYQGVDAAVSGPYGELQKNYQQEIALQAAYDAQKLALDKRYNDQNEAQHATHVAALNKLDADRAKEQQAIDQARGTLQLQAASNLFGQLATLSSSHNSKMARIGKAAAIAQAIITTYQSANEAFAAMASIPYIGPALGAAAAAVAIAAGLANVAAIRAQPVGGYAEGGYTGAGGKHQVAGVVHAGEVVWSQSDIARAGGVPTVEALRRGYLRGYADGGFVSPYANAPSPADLGFTAPRQPRVNMRDFAANDDAHARQAPPPVHVFAVFDPAELADKVMNSGPGHKVIINVAGDNPRAIQGKWST